jgi:hypothetical protein
MCLKIRRLHTLSTALHTDRQCVSAVCRKETTELQAFTHKYKIKLFCVNSVVVMYWMWFSFKQSVTSFLKLALHVTLKLQTWDLNWLYYQFLISELSLFFSAVLAQFECFKLCCVNFFLILHLKLFAHFRSNN